MILFILLFVGVIVYKCSLMNGKPIVNGFLFFVELSLFSLIFFIIVCDILTSFLTISMFYIISSDKICFLS